MPRGVRFDGREDGGQYSGGTIADAASKLLGRFNLLDTEDELSIEVVSKLLDQDQLAAAEKELQREKQLKALGSQVMRVLVVLSGLALTLCVVMLAIYLDLKPVAPDFEVITAGFVSVSINPLTPAQIAAQQATRSASYFSAYFTFNASYTVKFSNPNRKTDFFVDHVELIIFYNGFRLGSTKRGPFTQLRSTSQTFKIFVVQTDLKVPLNVYYTMVRSPGKPIFFGTDVTMKGRMSTIAGMKSPPFMFRVRCQLVLLNYIIIEQRCYRRNLG